MRKDIESEIEIKLEFDKNSENPARLFRSLAKLVDSINEFDFLMASTIDSTVTSKVYINDFEKGSLITKLRSALIIGDDKKLDNEDNSENIKEHIRHSRDKAFEFIAEGKSSVQDVENFVEEINESAKNKNLTESFNYAEPNLLDLAKVVNKINESTDDLTKNEFFEIKKKKDSPQIKTGNSKINIDDVEEALTKETIEQDFEIYYKIKKPDFLGDSQWEFKHGTKTLKIKITHSEWLDKFHLGKIIVKPGDSLKVKVNQVNSYNTNGYLLSEKKEIIEVLEIRNN